MNSALQSGFVIEKIGSVRGHKILTVDSAVPLVSQEFCPADDTRLRTVCTLVGEAGKQRLRIGCCPVCGYVGYIDRPSEDWIENFYLHTWDDAASHQASKKADSLRSRYDKKDLGKEREIVGLVSKFVLDKKRSVAEIGCGYGKTLKRFQLSGYPVIGVENSVHRAEIANSAYDLRVLVGRFESAPVQTELKKLTPFTLLYSYHVLEHVYQPAETLKLMSDLQQTGDYLGVSVPNFFGETSAVVFGYFPHLHSFTPVSIEKLLNRFGYGIVASQITKSAINILARKGDKGTAIFSNIQDPFSFAVEKFNRGLDLGNHRNTLRRFWWIAKTDRGWQSSWYRSALAESLHWLWLGWLARLRQFRKVVLNYFCVRNLERRYTDVQTSPLEIQFNGPIKLFYK